MMPAQYGGVACPKPRSAFQDRIVAKRETDKKAREFRDAVWARDQGTCRHCQRKVYRTLERIKEAGHVHHRRGRNVAPEDRYNVQEAVLLCLECHSDPAVVQKFRRL